jgi:hypothetical protein
MNFKRERVTRGTRPELSPEQLDFFLTGIDFAFFWDEPERERDWRAAREDILADWIRDHAGTRPAAWWKYDAPELRRLRVGGRGDVIPAYDHDTNLRFGIFRKSAFVDERLLAAVAPVGDGLVPLDENDPPRYESQASYLDRHGFLSAAERKRLTDADFEPEAIR